MTDRSTRAAVSAARVPIHRSGKVAALCGGAALLAAAAAMLTTASLHGDSGEGATLKSVGTLIYDRWPEFLRRVRTGIEVGLGSAPWDYGVLPLLRLPAFLLPALPGALLMAWGWRMKSREHASLRTESQRISDRAVPGEPSHG